MDWKYKLKRKLGNRYAMTAVLFLCVLCWGAFTVLFGAAGGFDTCGGFVHPAENAPLAKADPNLPHRSDLAAPALPWKSAGGVSWAKDLTARAAAAESAVTKSLETERSLIQLYGAFQSLADRTVVEDTAEAQYSVVRLPDGALTFVGEGMPSAQVQAAELARLHTALEERDISLLYLQAPSKLEPGRSQLPYGLYDPSNDCADRLLRCLEEKGVDCIDLRQTLAESGTPWADWFYRTDHHWNQTGAFAAFQALAEKLADYDQTLPAAGGVKKKPIAIDPRLTQADTFSVTTLHNFFLGSQGKRVGTAYAGVDDFQLWTPRMPTLLHYAVSTDIDRYGSFKETLLFPQRVAEKDLFGNNPYTYYSGGDYPLAQVTNYYNPEGPRILLVRDSFACAITPYLALASSQLTTLDPRVFQGDFLTCVDNVKPDVVVILYSSGMVRSEEPYRLLAQPAAPSKADALKWKAH